MFDPIIILFILTIAILESFTGLPAGPELPPLALSLFISFGVVTLVGLSYALNAVYLFRFDRTGSRSLPLRIYRLATIAQLLLGGHWVVSVLWFDWIGTVRRSVGGDVIGIDETLAVLPFLIGLFLIYGLPYAIQQRMREASLARWLDQGEPVPRASGYWSYVIEAVRHRAAIILVPVFLLTVVAESLDRLFTRVSVASPGFRESPWADLLPPLAQTAVAVVVLCFMPLLLRIIWRTTSLANCPTRERLERMCAEQGVRIRDILVWHTSSGMLNGALIGVVPRLRYILLTDGLLERLPAVQLEAVMAHEIAHARRHHLPWLLGTMVGVVTVCTAGIWLLARPVLLRLEDTDARMFWGDSVAGGALLIALIVAFLCFGHVSRRFERQADAFATQHLSGVRFARGSRVPTDRCQIISGPAVRAMQQALGSVAAVGGMPLDRFTFRHGSIGARQRALSRLVCRPARCLPIDRAVGRIKLFTVVLLLGAVALTVVQIEAERRDAQEARRQMVREWFQQSQAAPWFPSPEQP